MRRCDILIVEDDDDLRAAVTSAMEREGLVVSAAGDAAGGLALARDRRPSVLLVDLVLGGESGDAEAFVRALREEEACRDVPVVVVSGAHDVCRRAARIGAARALPKPFSLAELLDAVRPHCPRLAAGSTAPVRRRRGRSGASA
jgi:DNA-binding response OmpR family regulator